MPELPEVETIMRGIMPHLIGRTITSVEVARRDLRLPVSRHIARQLHHQTVTKVERRAKYIIMYAGEHAVLIHLGMSGQLLLFSPADYVPRLHDHVQITLNHETLLVFHDPRRFGLVITCDAKSVTRHALLAGLGVEPLSPLFTPQILQALLVRSKAPIKSLLMNQHLLVGVGNIYASEALFRAAIHPARPAASVRGEETEALHHAIQSVLQDAIASGGSTLRDYVRSTGDVGYFQHHFAVYGRAGQPCNVCGQKVTHLQQAGRSSFYCPSCQPYNPLASKCHSFS